MEKQKLKSKKWLFALLPFGVLLHIAIIVVLLFLLLYEDTSYYKNTNWSVTDEEFEAICKGYYSESITEIMEKYDIDCDKVIEVHDKDLIFIYVYNDNFTLFLRFINFQKYAKADFTLYYYGDGTSSGLNNYDNQRNLVNALNDFTNLVAYDAITSENRFESLYNEARTSKEGHADENIYFDNLIGYVEYYVYLNENKWGYYYLLQKDEAKQISSNRFAFEGLLKSVE